MNNKTSIPSKSLLFGLVIFAVFFSCKEVPAQEDKYKYVPDGYLDEAKQIPDYWMSTLSDIQRFTKEKVKKGQVEVCGTSAGGRPIISISYGTKRKGGGSTTFSGSTAVSDISVYRGEDSDKLVYMGIAGVHGFELEGIVGMLNLIEVFETGKDLKGKAWPELAVLPEKIGRIVLIPLVNPDGRARVPIIMEPNRGGAPDSFTVHEYLNTGGKKDGTIIGWPDVKKYIPMKFDDFGFAGGYPNDAGVNIMHDDFLGSPQPETRMLFDIAAAEKPDLIMNMHTGVPKNNYFMQVHRPFCEPGLQPVFDQLYRKTKTSLAHNKLLGSEDLSVEADPSKVKMSFGTNLGSALNLLCGALSVVIESPSHGFSGTNLAGEPAVHTPEMLIDAQLIAHRESLKFLLESGGRPAWEKMAKADK
ncbi:hypothetical protein [Sinomicrobium sp.]